MYTLLILLIVVAAAGMVFAGATHNKKRLIAAGILVALAGYVFFWLMGFWGEMLWFRSIGFESRFWTFELTRLGFVLGGFVLGYLIVYYAVYGMRSYLKPYHGLAAIAGGLITSIWGSVHWDTFLRYIYRVESGITEPILGRDTGFYLFTLPFLDSLILLAMLLTIVSLITAASGAFTWQRENDSVSIHHKWKDASDGMSAAPRTLYYLTGVLFIVLAAMKYVDRYHLLLSDYGVVYGAGWTDANVRLPAMTLITIFTLLISLLFFIPALRQLSARAVGSISRSLNRSWLSHSVSILGATLLVWLMVLTIIPGLFQLLRVEPNELRVERPYLLNNIEFTLQAFALDRVEEREFPVVGAFTEDTYEDNQLLFDNIRLWDYRALQQTYRQFQEIRLYYVFNDIDIDRYTIADEYRQVMLAAREMEHRELPEQSQTFVNKRFFYTHGMGVALNTVSEFTLDGQPKLLVEDIPPRTEYPILEIEQPRIYFGELTRTHVIANSHEEEFDYPMGDENVYYSYTGDGGVEFSNFWRRWLFGWKFDGTRLLFSGVPKSDSRVLFYRQISERVNKVAPFLTLDDDPYIAVIDGRLKWIVDAYTTSSHYPYSEPFDAAAYEDIAAYRYARDPDIKWSFQGKNYLRNSVKAIVDAYTGKIDLYIFEEEDPVIRVWQNIVPGLFTSRDDMPESVRRHIRYPIDMLSTQGLVYAKYHMTDPTVFYNQEDLWVRATENYYGREQPVEPYFIMWKPPQEEELEYILMQPYTPKTRQVAIAWIAGMCDGDNYGRLLAYLFPKEKRILGPQQFETRVDQDPHLSGQLSLWDQRGSRVIRGNVLMIPVEETLVYVEPIFLEAEAAAYPELRLIAMMHEDRLSYADNFQDAIRGLFEDVEDVEPVAPAVFDMDELIQQADRAFEDYAMHTGRKEFDAASRALQELEEAIQELYRFQQENPQ